MSYQSQIQSRQQAQFAELYIIQVGNDTWYYTSHLRDIEYQGNTYLARPIERGDYTKTSELKSVQMTISASIDDLLARYIGNTVVEDILVKIYRLFLETEEAILLFSGEVIDLTPGDAGKGAAISLTLEKNTDILRVKVPKLVFQSGCNNYLFDDRCGLFEIDYLVTAVIEVDGSDLVSAVFAGYDDDYFTRGFVRAKTDMRMITNHVGDRITLHFPFAQTTLASGQSANVYPGCDGKPLTCRDKFENLDKFFGFPYIPSSNPTIWEL